MNLQKDVMFVQLLIVQINCECKNIMHACMKQKAIPICLYQSL